MSEKSRILLFTFFVLISICIGLTIPGARHHIEEETPFIVVLGNVQDGGSPHIGCEKECCADLWQVPDPNRMVVSLGLVDPTNKKNFLFEATPDFPEQLELLRAYSPFESQKTPDGIFLTHAHIGHYTGLMYLGKEAMGSSQVPVFVMPEMRSFLEQNGPWSQLVEQQNVQLNQLEESEELILTSNLQVTPFRVPHRDEFSETVGYLIKGPSKSAVLIPDIDKWEKWNIPIEELISEVDYAFLDATFYNDDELPGRNMADIPHPFVSETMDRLKDLPSGEKKKVYFIHFNHTNKLLNKDSKETELVISNGFNIARLGDKLLL